MNNSKKPLFIALAISAIAIILIATITLSRSSANTSTREVETYMACGCGGCGGTEPQIKQYSKARSEEKQYREAIVADEQIKKSSMCTMAGCGTCTKLILVE